MLLSKFIYDHVSCKYDIILFACECFCAMRRGGCCCIVLLTTLSPLDAVRLSTWWLIAPIMAVTAFPFLCTNAWWSFYMYISFFIPFELLYCLYYCLFLSEVTNKVKLLNQSISQWTRKELTQLWFMWNAYVIITVQLFLLQVYWEVIVEEEGSWRRKRTSQWRKTYLKRNYAHRGFLYDPKTVVTFPVTNLCVAHPPFFIQPIPPLGTRYTVME